MRRKRITYTVTLLFVGFFWSHTCECMITNSCKLHACIASILYVPFANHCRSTCLLPIIAEVRSLQKYVPFANHCRSTCLLPIIAEVRAFCQSLQKYVPFANHCRSTCLLPIIAEVRAFCQSLQKYSTLPFVIMHCNVHTFVMSTECIRPASQGVMRVPSSTPHQSWLFSNLRLSREYQPAFLMPHLVPASIICSYTPRAYCKCTKLIK